MKAITGTYALIPSTNYGTFTGDGSPETRLVRIAATTTDEGKAALTLTTVGTFHSREEAFNEVVFCPGCKMTYLHSHAGEHFATVAHAWDDIPGPLRGLAPERTGIRYDGTSSPSRSADHFTPITELTDPEVIADRRAEAMGA